MAHTPHTPASLEPELRLSYLDIAPSPPAPSPPPPYSLDLELRLSFLRCSFPSLTLLSRARAEALLPESCSIPSAS